MSLEDDKLQFIKDMGITEAEVEESGLSIEILQEIAEDYKKNELILLDEAEYIAKKIQRCESVHSVRWRIKSVSHLIKKIVRKLIGKEPSEKYRDINVNNYKTIVF